jgi:hypothetical protein
MTDVDARARAMLSSFRAATSPSRASEDDALAAVEARIVAGDAEDEVAPPPAGVGFHVRSAGIAVAIAAAVLLAIRAVSIGVSTLAAEDAPVRDAASDTPVIEQAQPIAPERSVVAPVPASPRIEPAPALVPPDPPVLAPSERRAPAPPASGGDDLVAEVALLRAAKAEGDAAAALALLDRHAREFQNGSLARERSVLRAERLCALGRTDEARTLADRFVAAHANDPLAPRMDKVCRAE